MLDIYALLHQASVEHASDVHISVGATPRFRIHGELVNTNFQKMTPSDTLEVMLNLMNPEQREQFEENGEIDLSVSIPDAGRFRVNAYKQRGSISLTLRLVDMKIPDAEMLNISNEIMELCNEKRGLILVTGPSGSGKSTVIASMVDRINATRSCNIITLEDPIEYLHAHKMSIVNQREIGLDVKDYETAMAAALRQDPDVLEVSHLNTDTEVRQALMAAETGRLVFTSMYTMSAVETVENLIDLFPQQQRIQVRNRLANALKATISRQLLVSTNGERIPAYEILFVDNHVREIIRHGDIYSLHELMKKNHAKGMITMDESVFKLYKSGKISRAEAIQASADQEAMTLAIDSEK
ncbi:twitching motility protein PilT [Lachnospiraceae bacterium]|nr:twitching motility protein PilT [Lachnospiraceae bacterium]